MFVKKNRLQISDSVQGAHALLHRIIQVDPKLDEIGRARCLLLIHRIEQVVLGKLVRELFVIDALFKFLYFMIKFFFDFYNFKNIAFWALTNLELFG